MVIPERYVILDSLSDAVLLINRDYTIAFANHHFLQLCATSAEEIVGEKCYQILHHSPFPCAQGNLPSTQCIHRQVFETGRPARVAHYHDLGAGEKKFLEISASPLQDGQGNISQLVTVIRDSTAQEKARERGLLAIIEEEDAIFRSAPFSLTFLDRDLRIIRINSAMEELVGFTLAEVKGRHCYDLWGQHAQDDKRQGREKICDDCKVEDARRHGQTYQHERQVGDKHLLITSSPVRNRAGAIVGTLECGQDVTALCEADRKARQAKEEWERTFNAMPDIVTIQDREMHIVRANKAAEDFFEVGPGELIGTHCYKIFRGSEEPCKNCPLAETLVGGGNHREIVRHPNLGKIFQVSSAAIYDSNGDLAYLVHVAQDISRQKQLEEELLQAHKMEAIGTLAGGVAHDFNNILSAIVGYAELAKMEVAEDTQVAADLGEVLRAAQRASDLVKQILTFSRKGSHEREALQPYLLVKEALKLLRASLPATMEIIEDIDPDSGAILADPTKIHQIVVNLCTNALHALAEESGKVTVTVKRRDLDSQEVAGHPGVEPGEFVELMVADNGCGMSTQVQRRIFEPYYTTKATGKGTGLGLAVVLGIVNDYGGLIKVESEVGKGTTFHVFFPAMAAAADMAAGGPEGGGEATLPKGTERILTVDDEQAIIALQKSSLSRLGYKVTARSSSEEALALFRDDPQGFDVLITDQTMPHLSGRHLAEEVLRLRPDLPIILCTGYSAVVSKQEALDLGIKRYLLKPVAIHELARVVREVLDG